MDEMLAKNFRKKPKEILVMDCVYFSQELDAVRKEAHRVQKEMDELNSQYRVLAAKFQCLRHVNGKLTDAITSMRDGLAI